MDRPTRRVALMLDLRWPDKRHAEVYAGIQRFAEGRGWVTIIDEFAHDTLRRRTSDSDRSDGIVARANHPPARHLHPGVVPVTTAVGRLLAEHLPAREFRTFATLTSPKNADDQRRYEVFRRELGVSPGEYRRQRHLRNR